MRTASPACDSFALADGVVGVAPGLAWLPASRALVAADAHLAYEDVIGGALPLWSTAEIGATLAIAVARLGALEVVLLGDVVHGARMSDGAARIVRGALDALRRAARVTLVAGNHEGRSRAFAVLGETVDETERDGWLLVHGDRPSLAAGRRAIVGHLHPSVHLGGRSSAPAFVASERLVVLPALTPYSPGLDLLSREFAAAVGAWSSRRDDAHVVVVTSERLYPFGSHATLHETLRAPKPARRMPPRFRRRIAKD